MFGHVVAEVFWELVSSAQVGQSGQFAIIENSKNNMQSIVLCLTTRLRVLCQCSFIRLVHSLEERRHQRECFLILKIADHLVLAESGEHDL